MAKDIRQRAGEVPFSQEELKEFSKTERAILYMIHAMKYDEAQIMMGMEIKTSTLRWHMSNIKRKVSMIRTKRFDGRTELDVQRQQNIALPAFTPSDDEPTEVTKIKRPRGRPRGKGKHPPPFKPMTQEEIDAHIDEVLPMPIQPLNYKRFFNAEPPPIQRATANLPPSFHPPKVEYEFEVGYPIAHEKQLPFVELHQPQGVLENPKPLFGSFRKV